MFSVYIMHILCMHVYESNESTLSTLSTLKLKKVQKDAVHAQGMTDLKAWREGGRERRMW